MDRQNSKPPTNIIYGLIIEFADQQPTKNDYVLSLTLDSGQIVRFTYDFIERFHGSIGKIKQGDQILIDLKPVNNKNNIPDNCVRVTIWRNDVHIKTFKLPPQKLEITKK